MNKFNGIDQKKKDRSTKDWLNAKRKELPKVVKSFMDENPGEADIENFYTTYVETTAEVINHFGNFFKAKNK